MKTTIDWPDVYKRGLVHVTLTRSDLKTLLAGLDARHTGQPGLVSVEGDLCVVLVAVEAE